VSTSIIEKEVQTNEFMHMDMYCLYVFRCMSVPMHGKYYRLHCSVFLMYFNLLSVGIDD